MKLTDQQKQAVYHDGHTVITACPGSGKTRTIIARILKCIDELSETPRKVACITYTNTAVREIESRIRARGTGGEQTCYEVSTIHAFCQANILGKYYWLSEAYREGYTVLPPDHDAYAMIVEKIGDRFGLSDFARSQFEMLNRTPEGAPLSESIPQDAAYAFWEELESQGFIDFSNIVYHAYRILCERPSIAHNLSCRFAHLLVDEFQDTSALQVKILELIHAQGHTTFFLVGDPDQSIYRFAGARRELMADFAGRIGAKGFPVSGNFRATKPLVDYAERLIARQPSMISTSSLDPLTPSVAYAHTQCSFEAMTDHFLPYLEANGIGFGRTAVLAQNWFLLRPLGQQLRDYGIPVTGPGSRPYKRRFLLGRIAEQVCAYLESREPTILHQAEKELGAIASELTGKPAFWVYSYKGKQIVQRLIREGGAMAQIHEGAAAWLDSAAKTFEKILIEDGVIPLSYAGCLQDSKEKMFEEMERQQIDVRSMALGDLGMLADPRKNMKLMTMHSAKGREFEAVAIIGAHDGLVPFHNFYNPLTDDGLAESRRLFYVAMTRAERALWIFSSENSRELPPTRFLSELELA